MSLRIRLQRVGKKNQPIFRVVVINKKESTKGKPVDIIGIYNPVKHTGTINFEKYEKWIKLGAKPSETVERLYAKMSKNKKTETEILSAISTQSSSQ
ncbi:MAG: 30S ribosomal protein S16 [Endomicrobia bacterium]|nr:30S ribosomal protein S16 [Endomicrobiia bacterium]